MYLQFGDKVFNHFVESFNLTKIQHQELDRSDKEKLEVLIDEKKFNDIQVFLSKIKME